MALTKVTKTGITDDAINADKIENGTVTSTDITDGTITNEKLAGSIANDKLTNSSITLSGTSVSLGGTVSVGIQWQSVVTADGSTATSAVAGYGYFIDTTSATHTLTLPGSPSAGDTVHIKDYAGTFGTNALTINRNGNNIQGSADNSQITTNRASVTLVYFDATKGWLYTNESNVADLQQSLFTSATGGTITTSGDYKIHTFTGDGCFVVSALGNGPSVPTGGPNTVSYMVVAGGGGGGNSETGGGGGAGGFREGRDIAPSYTASPLVAPSGLTITQTTYPVTVGGGGSSATAGSNSIFSTITSAGGGEGVRTGTGGSGGSGGGGARNAPGAGGSGNTPSVSPPQGNPGGNRFPFPYVNSLPNTGGGGGGAGSSGTSGSSPTGGPGGSGVTTSIIGSPTTYAGGGGGGAEGASGGSGGSGGGAAGLSGGDGATGNSATANTGGGGGGTGWGPSAPAGSGGSGGKGIVVIRYKYQ